MRTKKIIRAVPCSLPFFYFAYCLLENIFPETNKQTFVVLVGGERPVATRAFAITPQYCATSQQQNITAYDNDDDNRDDILL